MELNHGPLDLQSNALPLSYTPIRRDNHKGVMEDIISWWCFVDNRCDFSSKKNYYTLVQLLICMQMFSWTEALWILMRKSFMIITIINKIWPTSRINYIPKSYTNFKDLDFLDLDINYRYTHTLCSYENRYVSELNVWKKSLFFVVKGNLKKILM